MADDEDLARIQLTVGDLLIAFVALRQRHEALVNALKELLPQFSETYRKHLSIRAFDEADLADGRELDSAQKALRDEVERVRNLRKNS
jgi:hypothetical protein